MSVSSLGTSRALMAAGDESKTAVDVHSAASSPQNDHDRFAVPEGGYGWVCVGCCFTLNALTWGIVASFGVYLSYYISTGILPARTTPLEHINPSDFSWIGGLNYGVGFAAAPLLAPICARVRTQPPIIIGAVLFGAGFIAASFASEVWHLLLSQGALVGLACGMVYIPSMNVLPQWFSKRRSLASGIAAAGSGVGGLAFALGTGAMIENIGLAWALRLTGIIGLVGNGIAGALIRDRDDVIKPRHHSFDVRILRNSEASLFLLWAGIHLLGYVVVQFSLSSYATYIGLTRTQADLMTALLSVGTLLCRPVIGLVSDRFGRLEVATGLTIISGVLCFAIWLPSRSLAPLAIFSLFMGGPYGVFWATVSPLCAEIMGLERLPALMTLAWLVAITPTALAEFIALHIIEPSLGRWAYIGPQVLAGGTFLASAVLLSIVCIKHRRRKAAMY